MRSRARRVGEGFAAALIAGGLIALLFMVHQIWGTRLVAARGQPVGERAARSVGRLVIPSIGLDDTVGEGATTSDLRNGPGHYAGTALPGEVGTAAIGAHRTTYGAPFARIDDLRTGDRIQIRTPSGLFVYRMVEQLVVRPSSAEVFDDTGRPLLLLLASHPRYSGNQRLVIVAELDERTGDEALTIPAEAVDGKRQRPESLDAGDTSGWAAVGTGTLLWTLAVGVVGFGWWMIHRGRRHWMVTVAGAVPFLIVLVAFFFALEELLPPTF